MDEGGVWRERYPVANLPVRVGALGCQAMDAPSMT